MDGRVLHLLDLTGPLPIIIHSGGCISGKKIIFLVNTVCSGHNYLKTIFGFEITILSQNHFSIYPNSQF